LLLQFWNNFTYKKEGMYGNLERSCMERGGGGGWQGEGKKKEGSTRDTYITEMNRKGMNT
jgi:hypothetical protein